MQSNEDTDLSRGALTALALVGLLLGLVALFAFAFGGGWQVVSEGVQRQFGSAQDAAADPSATNAGKTPSPADPGKPEDAARSAQEDKDQHFSPTASSAQDKEDKAPSQVADSAKGRAKQPSDSSRQDSAQRADASEAADAPHSAAEALRQVLQTYKRAPNRTATTTVSITSLGGIKSEGSGAPTVYDGLSPRSVSQGTEITTGLGSRGSRAGSPF